MLIVVSFLTTVTASVVSMVGVRQVVANMSQLATILPRKHTAVHSVNPSAVKPHPESQM